MPQLAAKAELGKWQLGHSCSSTKLLPSAFGFPAPHTSQRATPTSLSLKRQMVHIHFPRSPRRRAVRSGTRPLSANGVPGPHMAWAASRDEVRSRARGAGPTSSRSGSGCRVPRWGGVSGCVRNSMARWVGSRFGDSKVDAKGGAALVGVAAGHELWRGAGSSAKRALACSPAAWPADSSWSSPKFSVPNPSPPRPRPPPWKGPASWLALVVRRGLGLAAAAWSAAWRKAR
mmetsp:Transcript_9074/g.20432  ORF Transcript_9074/g.20432 Transcript_9074/m.20432 type:complete len:231 (-) Transcript_9074:1368-2060(-)